MAGKVVLVSADAKVDAGDFHGCAKMGIPNLTIRKRRGQEWQSRCKLAMLKLAIYVGYTAPSA